MFVDLVLEVEEGRDFEGSVEEVLWHESKDAAVEQTHIEDAVVSL